MVVILVLLTVIGLITVDYFVQRSTARKLALAGASPSLDSKVLLAEAPKSRTPNLNCPLPKGLFFDRRHQWLRLEDDGTVRLGLDPLALAALGNADKMEVKDSCTLVQEDQAIAVLKRGSRRLAVPALLDGEILEINSEALHHPEKMAQDPYGEGWLYRLTPKKLTTSFLASKKIGDEAKEWMQSEMSRLRDFLSAVPSMGEKSMVMAQDGGLPRNGFGEELSYEKWSELVDTFFK